MKYLLFATTVGLLSLSSSVEGHARWKCPSARDKNDAHGSHITFDNTGNKVGPCGPYSGKFGMGGITTLKPGLQTLQWEESVAHTGSPFRLALLDEQENVRAVLLDHIPHNDAAHPIPYLEMSYVTYKLTVEIPDVNCDKCTLQLLYFMTDKTTKCGVQQCTYYPEDSACSGHTDPNAGTCFGAPNSTPCKYADACFSNYHTCTDVKITGSTPLEALNATQPEDWPYRNMPSTYGTEAATWTNYFLQDVPAKFKTDAGVDLCHSPSLE